MKHWGLPLCVKRLIGGLMSHEKAAVYRLHAAHCTELAQRIPDPKGRLSLLEMSRIRLRLAEMTEAQQSAAATVESYRAEALG